MAGQVSDPALLSLHAVRLLGFANTDKVARRFSQDRAAVSENLLDFQATGWVSHSEFGGLSGWSITDRGRAENERLLAAELDACGARDRVIEVHQEFEALNGRFQQAATHWQIRPLPNAPLATNDHTDHRWDDRVIDTLQSLGRRLTELVVRLEDDLSRFSGYGDRYTTAASQVATGAGRWVDSIEIDSCHVVWMQLHEDLLATLGLTRS